jgi:hypothetical protein
MFSRQLNFGHPVRPGHLPEERESTPEMLNDGL